MTSNAFSAKNQPDFAIVVPAYNEADFLPKTLASLDQAIGEVLANETLRGEVIVVDNNSTDNTASVAREHQFKNAELSVVFEAENQISRARNAGAAGARADKLIFVDADTSVSGELLGAALAALDDGAVGGGARISIDVAHRGGELVTNMWNRFAAWAKYAAGCFVFCQREAFEAVGGFSEEVYASEEIWLARALKKWGKAREQRFVVLPQQVVTSGRKLEWLSGFAMFKQVLVIMLFPFALKYRRFCSAWYERPDKSV